MSTLLEQASLVMIPSGYKEDVVYSQIPTDGSGDLSFTRASNGTRVNSAGLVEVCPWNLLEYSEQFDNAIWGKGGGTTVTANSTTAPNGTTTADTIVLPNNGTIAQDFTSPSSATYTFSMYLKASSNTTIKLGFFSPSILTTCNVTTEWQRFEFSYTFTGTLYPQLYNNSGSSVTLFAWGAQVNLGTAKPYFPTTDRLNVPRLTYQNGGGGCPSLLLEKQSTNLLPYSEDLSGASWARQNTTVSTNNTTSPDGTQNADKLVADTTNARHLIYQAFSIVANTYTFTTYAKAGENSFLIMRLDTDAPEVKTWFNLSNGTIGTSQGGSPTITSVGNGWYRCSTQFVSSTTQTVYAVLYTAKTDGGEGFAGNDSDGTYIWGAQLEASSYATSYIPTTSSSATRVADACYKTGISSLIGQTEGTILLDWVQNAFNNTQGIYANNYNLTGSISVQISTNGTLQVFVCYAGTYFSIATSANAIQVGQRYKVGFAYKSGDLVLYLNGNLIATNTTSFAFTTTLDEIDLSNRTVYFANFSEISVNELVQIKTRISNADIQSWTA